MTLTAPARPANRRTVVLAALAGVVLALTIPLAVDRRTGDSSLVRLEHAIQPFVVFAIVPIFGFANAGVSFAGFTPAALLDPVPWCGHQYPIGGEQRVTGVRQGVTATRQLAAGVALVEGRARFAERVRAPLAGGRAGHQGIPVRAEGDCVIGHDGKTSGREHTASP